MLHMLCNGLSSVSGSSTSVSDACSSVLSISRGMLQMFHLDVSKVDRVLHPLLAFYCLASVSPPGAGWAFAAPSTSSQCSKCFSCFRCMFDMFHLDVATTMSDIKIPGYPTDGKIRHPVRSLKPHRRAPSKVDSPKVRTTYQSLAA
jgi:hypothetical protein